MRAHASPRLSVLAAARHARRAHAASQARGDQGPRPAAARERRGGAAPSPRRASGPQASRLDRIPRARSHRAFHPRAPRGADAAGDHPRRHRRRTRRRATACRVGPGSEAIFLPACYKPLVSREPDMADFRDHVVTSAEALERIYGEPYGPSIAKETDRITTQYRAFIEAAPFFALATVGPDGLDCDPRVALLFLIPGCGETIRINGRVAISTDPELCASFAVNEKAPRAVLVVSVDRIFYQCSKAIVRSKLWDPSRHIDRKSLPSNGTILAELTDGKLGGEAHDRAAPARLKATLY